MVSENKLLESFIIHHPREALNELEKYEPSTRVEIMASFPSSWSSILIKFMDRFHGSQILEGLEPQRSAEIMEQLPLAVTTDLLRLMDSNTRYNLLTKVPEELADNLRTILSFSKDSVGAYIDASVFTLYSDLTVEQGLEKVKSNHLPILGKVLVLDVERKLVGQVDIKALLSNPQKKIQSVMDADPLRILADTSISSSFLNEWAWEESALPVVDVQNQLVGILRRSTLSKIASGNKRFNRNALEAGSALGDLYQIGLTGLFGSTGK